MEDNKKLELTDDALDSVTGGTSATYRCGCCKYAYNPDEHVKCPNCGTSSIGQLLKPISMTR